MLLTEAIEALCIATRANGRSLRTVYAYHEKLGHLVTFLGDVDVESITVTDLRRFVNWQMDERKLSPFTILTRVRAFKRLFNWLVEEEEIKSNPSKKIRTPNPKPEPKSLAFDDIQAMLAQCDDSVAGKRDRAIILFLLDSGCRAAGLCDMFIDDLDLRQGIAKVVEKGKKPRFVMCTDDPLNALQEWLEARPESESNTVFLSLRSNKPLTPNGVWQMINRRAKQAGISGPVSVHGFRHTFATRYLIDGGDLASLADLLGHEDVSTTKRWYGNFTLNQLQEMHSRHSPVVQMMKET